MRLLLCAATPKSTTADACFAASLLQLLCPCLSHAPSLLPAPCRSLPQACSLPHVCSWPTLQFARIYTPVILAACILLAFLPWSWSDDRKV